MQLLPAAKAGMGISPIPATEREITLGCPGPQSVSRGRYLLPDASGYLTPRGR